MRKFLRALVLIAALALIGTGAYSAIKVYLGYKEGRDEYKNLSGGYTTLKANEDGVEAESETEISTEIMVDENGVETIVRKVEIKRTVIPADAPQRREIDWEGLLAQNEDIIAWIDIPAIDASYPVMQSEDNDYYLHRGFDREYLFAGCLFLDYHNNSNFRDYHSILYGHNMRDGSMFGRLRELRSQENVDANPYIWIYTPETDILCRIFSVHNTGVNSETYTISFSDMETWSGWIERQIEASQITSPDYPTTDDRIVTLSTCVGDDSQRETVLTFEVARIKTGTSKDDILARLYPEMESESERISENTGWIRI